MMSLSSRFPFKAWYSWYLRTPHAKIKATSLLWKTPVISSNPHTWPDSETTLTAASSTCSTDMSLTLEARASREAAIHWCCAAMSDKSPWNSCFPMPPAEAMETSERSSTSLDASVSSSMTMNCEGSSSSKCCIGSVPGTTLVIICSSSPDPIIRSSPGGPKYEVANLLSLTSGLTSASSTDCCWAALSLSCLDKNRGG